MLLLVSFTLGLIFSIIHNFIKKIKFKKKLYKYLFNYIYFLMVTILYIYIIYILNKGYIHLYMKIVLIIGFIIMNLLFDKKCKL